MGRHDAAAYEYLSQAEYFADLFNAKFFDGRTVVDSEKLVEADSRVQRGGEDAQYRDIIKRLPNGARFVVLAIENQDNIDYEMPWRIMGYDHAEYQRQISEIHERKRRKASEAGKKLSWLEAKMGAEDKLSPVWTICFYHGKQPWTGPRSLKDMMDMVDFADFPETFSDYHMHLVCADDVGLAEKCNTQLGLLLRVLAARGDREQMEALKNSDEFNNVDEATSRAIAKLADMPKLLERVEKGEKESGGGYSMCVAIDEMMERAKEETRAEMCVAIDEMMERAKEAGRAEMRGAIDEMVQEGVDRVNSLNMILIKDNRLDDLQRATRDREYQKLLFCEFGL